MNIAVVEVNYLFWSGSSPLIFVILFSVLLGGVVTMLVGSRKYIALKRENRRLRRKVEQFENAEPVKEISDPAKYGGHENDE